MLKKICEALLWLDRFISKHTTHSAIQKLRKEIDTLDARYIAVCHQLTKTIGECRDAGLVSNKYWRISGAITDYKSAIFKAQADMDRRVYLTNIVKLENANKALQDLIREAKEEGK